MTRTIRFSIALIILFAISLTTIYAQHPGSGMGNATPEQRATRLTERMKEDLKLTAAQEPKVAAINLKFAKSMENIKKIADTAAQRKIFDGLNKQKETELKGILTADQLKLYQKMVEEMMARRRQMPR
jgi:periplasmic protein CpxP/Spy